MKDNYDLIWNLFKKTGNINYYLMAKKIEGEDRARDKENRGNNNR